MLKPENVPNGVDLGSLGNILYCDGCKAYLPVWEAPKVETDGILTFVCPECGKPVEPLRSQTPMSQVKIPSIETMKALLLQALLGANLEPLLRSIDNLSIKVDMLRGELKVRNELEERKISYNEVLDKARLYVKEEMKRKKRGEEDGGKEKDNNAGRS